MNPDVLLQGDGGYWLMSGLSEAGHAFVRAHCTRLDYNGKVSIGAAGYANVIAGAKTAGLEVRVQ